MRLTLLLMRPRQPTVEKLLSSIKQVESGIIDKQDLIEELSMRVKSIRLSTPGSRKSLGPSSRQSLSLNTRPKSTTFQIPSEITAEVERQLDQSEKKPTFSARVARSTRVSKTPSTVSVGGLGMPGKIDISAFIRQEQEVVKKEEEEQDSDSIAPHAKDERPRPGSSSSLADSKPIQSPTGTSTGTVDQSPSFPSSFNLSPAANQGGGSISGSTPAFGGISFSLDPGDLSSTHTRSRTSTSGSSRAHHAAPRLSASPASSPTASSTGPSFFPPPGEVKPSSEKAGPKGFVSFSGFGQK